MEPVTLITGGSTGIGAATARALAAFEGAGTVGIDHLTRIAPSALRHRLRRNPLDEAGSTARVAKAVAEVFGP